MEPIIRLKSRRDKRGNMISYGLFLCDSCKKLVVKIYSKGTRDKSCGCRRVLQNDSQHPVTWESKRLCGIWYGMKKRCYNETDIGYKWYGKRGITICEEWLDNPSKFEKFALENGYSDDLQIDRIDNDGNYEPSNCRFVTNAQNGRNKSDTKLSWVKVDAIRDIHSQGETMIKDLAEIFDVDPSTVSYVLQEKRWKYQKQ
jgi:hypothetical protein